MDQYFMDLYRTRLYLPLVFLILAYVVSPQFRRIFTKAGRWIDGRKTWQAAQRFLFFCVSVSFIPGKAGAAISASILLRQEQLRPVPFRNGTKRISLSLITPA